MWDECLSLRMWDEWKSIDVEDFSYLGTDKTIKET
jgi:hypothetical protein